MNSLSFFRSPFLLPLLYPSLLWRVPTTSKILYLTFDDGPVEGPTEFALQTLAVYQANATFFCIGDNVRKHHALFTEVWKRGHVVGNHTFHHLKGWNCGVEQYLDDIHRCSAQMGIQEKLFRPPYGRITRKQIRQVRPSHQIVMWDVLTHDYSKNISKEQSLKGSISVARPGSIVVFHDSYKAERNMTYVLPRFLDHFANKGYSFAVIPT